MSTCVIVAFEPIPAGMRVRNRCTYPQPSKRVWIDVVAGRAAAAGTSVVHAFAALTPGTWSSWRPARRGTKRYGMSPVTVIVRVVRQSARALLKTIAAE